MQRAKQDPKVNFLTMSSLTRWSADCVLDVRAGLGEGPVWWAEQNCLLWVDIEACRVGIFDLARRHNRWLDVGSHVGCVTPTAHGDLLVACVNGFHWPWNAQSQLVKLRSSSYELFWLWVRFGRGEANESLRGTWSPRQSTMATVTPSVGR